MREIIETRAFSLRHGNPAPEMLNMFDAPEVFNMVEKFVERCAGSPLAASNRICTLYQDKSGRMEHCAKQRDHLHRGVWNFSNTEVTDLPPHIKQCFAFCSVFPKDYVICVDMLIQLWIANDFIPEQEVRLETTGKHICPDTF